MHSDLIVSYLKSHCVDDFDFGFVLFNLRWTFWEWYELLSSDVIYIQNLVVINSMCCHSTENRTLNSTSSLICYLNFVESFFLYWSSRSVMRYASIDFGDSNTAKNSANSWKNKSRRLEHSKFKDTLHLSVSGRLCVCTYYVAKREKKKIEQQRKKQQHAL